MRKFIAAAVLAVFAMAAVPQVTYSATPAEQELLVKKKKAAEAKRQAFKRPSDDEFSDVLSPEDFDKPVVEEEDDEEVVVSAPVERITIKPELPKSYLEPDAAEAKLTDGRYDDDDMKVTTAGNHLRAIGKKLPRETVNGESIGFLRFSAAGAATLAGAAATVPSSTSAISSWLVTVSPVFFNTCFNTPSTGDGTSSTTLSVSRSTRFSSRRIASPGCLCQVAMVASETDSGNTGSLTSMAMAKRPYSLAWSRLSFAESA